VRWYLDGFSDAIVPNSLPPEQKVEAILNWMRAEPSRAIASDPDALSKRDPETTLTYKQLLNVCGTATNAFLNLARSSDLRVRRLLLLAPDRTTKHVVAEARNPQSAIRIPGKHGTQHQEEQWSPNRRAPDRRRFTSRNRLQSICLIHPG